MLTLEDLTDILGLSKPQLRRRLTALNGIIDGHLSRGKNNELLVDNSGLELLKQLEDYRQQGKTLREAADIITDELNVSTVKPRETDPHKLITQLERENELLREQLNRKDQEIERLHTEIQQLLPGTMNQKGFLRRFWERIW